jgi:hypothetical protein
LRGDEEGGRREWDWKCRNSDSLDGTRGKRREGIYLFGRAERHGRGEGGNGKRKGEMRRGEKGKVHGTRV